MSVTKVVIDTDEIRRLAQYTAGALDQLSDLRLDLEAILQRLKLGERVAYVSDAGTPAISDPGARLVGAVRQDGLLALVMPGPSSVTAALSVAGIAGDQQAAAVGSSGRGHGACNLR